MSTQVTIIGAGSVVFSLGLVKDLCLTPGLQGSKVFFMDIDADRLETVYRLAIRYAEDLGADLQFEKSLDREAALAGADFVVNTATYGFSALVILIASLLSGLIVRRKIDTLDMVTALKIRE